MIKLVFHIADIHLRNYAMHDQYRKILNKVCVRFSEISEKYSYEEIRIVIAGDFFHQKISISNEQTMFAAWFLNKISKIGKVIIIPGNHDFLENNHGRLDSITPVVNLIENPNVVYYRHSGVYDDENIKWVVYSLYDENKRPEFENDGNHKYVGLFHGPIVGSKTNTGYVFDHGYEMHIFSGLDIVLAGDIHSKQKLEYQDGDRVVPFWYCGSLLQQNIGEYIEEHGFGMYHVQENKYEFEEVENDMPYLKFRITDIEQIETNGEELVNTIKR